MKPHRLSGARSLLASPLLCTWGVTHNVCIIGSPIWEPSPPTSCSLPGPEIHHMGQPCLIFGPERGRHFQKEKEGGGRECVGLEAGGK